MTETELEKMTTRELSKIAFDSSVCEEERDAAVAELARRY